MKITRIAIENFQCIPYLYWEPSAPITLLAGKNEQGKSSVLDAVRLAMTGESPRVKLKKDRTDMVRDGTKGGSIAVCSDSGTALVALPNGKDARPEADPMLALVLDPPRFAALEPNARRNALLDLAGVSMDPGAIEAKLKERGADPAKVAEIAPLLRGGFQGAEAEAKVKAREHKAAWRTITGETYGSAKATTWQPTILGDVATIAESVRAAQEGLDATDARLADLRAELQRRKSALAQLQHAQGEIAAATAAAEKRPRIEAKLANDEADLAAWTAKLELVTEARPTSPCPECGVLLHGDAKTGLTAAADAPIAPTSPEQVAQWREAHAMSKRAVENDRRDLRIAMEAAAKIAVLDAQVKSLVIEPAEETESAIGTLTAQRADQVREITGQQTRLREAEIASTAQARAAAEHTEVQAWDTMAAMLAPDGLPGELLAAALRPVNQRLAMTADRTGWAPVTIDEDMSIRIGGRLYGLCSESARWRADAALADAIAQLSHLRFFALDRVDVLDADNRVRLLRWMSILASTQEIDTVMMAGTFRSMPIAPPEQFDVRWIEGGQLVAPMMQEAA